MNRDPIESPLVLRWMFLGLILGGLLSLFVGDSISLALEAVLSVSIAFGLVGLALATRRARGAELGAYRRIFDRSGRRR